MNEIRLLRKLQHPSIISLHEVYESDQYVHLVLGPLAGAYLFSRLRKKQNYTEEYAMKIMKALLTVVSFLHAHQVVHRDIKPDNILLSLDLGVIA